VYPKTIGKLRKRLHETKGTAKWLESAVRGYFQYHAVPCNEERSHGSVRGVLGQPASLRDQFNARRLYPAPGPEVPIEAESRRVFGQVSKLPQVPAKYAWPCATKRKSYPLP
jgi:hypothetical protein